jgi:hypothetical protein
MEPQGSLPCSQKPGIDRNSQQKKSSCPFCKTCKGSTAHVLNLAPCQWGSRCLDPLILNQALEADEQSASCLGYFSAGEITPLPSGYRSRYIRCGESPPGFRSQLPSHPTCSLVTIPTMQNIGAGVTE